MIQPSDSTIELARSDVAELRCGLGELADWMGAQNPDWPPVDGMRGRLIELASLLDRVNAWLERQEKERAQLEGLFEVSRTVNSTLDLTQVLNQVIDVMIQVTRAERGFLMLSDEATGELTFQVARNLDRDTIARPSFQVSRSIVQRTAETGQSVITTDALQDPRFSGNDSVVSLHLRSIMCLPLKVKDRVVGVVYVDNRLCTGLFQPDDVNALRAFSDVAAIAIDNARLFASLRQKMTEIGSLKTLQDNILASIASGVIATDLDNRITSFNRAAESILSLSAHKLIGRSCEETLAPIVGSALPQLVDQVRRAGTRRIAAEFQATVPDRGPVSLHCNVSALRDGNGDPRGVTIVVEDLTEKRQLEATREMFRRYLSPAVVDRLPSDVDQLRLGGYRQQITILFADLRGFTRFSEPLPPEEIVVILNQYLSIAADAILRQEGTLDKFMGDAVMAIFNAPLEQADHVQRAARVALELRSAVERLHGDLPPHLRLYFGTGIHTGDAVVGNLGTQLQMNYTAIGDAVNLARRLEENASGGQIIVSDSAYRQIRDVAVVNALPKLKVKGRRKVERVWELTGLRD